METSILIGAVTLFGARASDYDRRTCAAKVCAARQTGVVVSDVFADGRLVVIAFSVWVRNYHQTGTCLLHAGCIGATVSAKPSFADRRDLETAALHIGLHRDLAVRRDSRARAA